MPKGFFFSLYLQFSNFAKLCGDVGHSGFSGMQCALSRCSSKIIISGNFSWVSVFSIYSTFLFASSETSYWPFVWSPFLLLSIDHLLLNPFLSIVYFFISFWCFKIPLFHFIHLSWNTVYCVDKLSHSFWLSLRFWYDFYFNLAFFPKVCQLISEIFWFWFVFLLDPFLNVS